jgi:hypothetical protein
VRSVRFTAASPCIGSKPQTLNRSDMHAHKRGCRAVQPRPKHDAASRTASYFGESPDPIVRPGRGRALTRLPRSLRRCSALATRNRFGDHALAGIVPGSAQGLSMAIAVTLTASSFPRKRRHSPPSPGSPATRRWSQSSDTRRATPSRQPHRAPAKRVSSARAQQRAVPCPPFVAAVDLPPAPAPSLRIARAPPIAHVKRGAPPLVRSLGAGNR